MLHIKRFIDKMTMIESRQNKDVVMPINDARGLRDEIVKLLADLHQLTAQREESRAEEVINIEVKGGTFK